MTERTLSTILIWHDSAGNECEAGAKVVYAIHKGSPQTMVDPACPDMVEIISISPTGIDGDIPDHFLEDDELLEECYQDYLYDKILAAEYRAEQRAEMLREDKGY